VPVLRKRFVCVFLYWVRPLVTLLTFAAFAFRVGVHSIGCALRVPHQTTSVAGKLKKMSLRVFFGVHPSGASPDPRFGPLGGESTPREMAVITRKDSLSQFLK
jgi:hypothetical protein